VPLQPPAKLKEQVRWQTHSLSASEVERKRAALQAHKSQYGYSAHYLVRFIRPNEVFGDFPLIQLRNRTAPTTLAVPPQEAQPAEPAEQLTPEEREVFVGVEWKFVRLEGDSVVVSFEFSRPLAEGVEASLSIFGYRTDRPFAHMPKIQFRIGETGWAVYDQNRKLSRALGRVTKDSRQITVRVPLKTLGEPQRLLTSARTYLGELPLDWVSWRLMELSPP
jgi:hypothetical protein